MTEQQQRMIHGVLFEINVDGRRAWQMALRWPEKTSYFRHRVDGGPAVELIDGTRLWLKSGEKHREDGLPAIEHSSGAREYYERGVLHRAGGLPAVEYANGDREYYENGLRHRIGGLPAVECVTNGAKYYYVRGKFCETKKESMSCQRNV